MDSMPSKPPAPAGRPVTITRRAVIGSVIVVLIAFACVRLGIWQLHRLEQKRTRNAAAQLRMREPPLELSALLRDSAGLIYRRALVSGSYDDEHTVIVAGRSLNGAPGVHILTPVRVGDTGILINRGWVPSADAASISLDSLREPAPDRLQGLILDLPYNPRAPQPDSTGFRRIWYRFNLAELQHQFPYPLANFVVQLLPDTRAPAVPRRLPPPVLDEGPHLGYAIQWFSFAVIGVAGWIILLFRSNRQTQ